MNLEDLSQDPNLEWEPVSKAKSYNIEVSQDSSFENLILNSSTKKNKFEWKLHRAGIYFWRVQAVDRDGKLGDFSKIASFQVILVPRVEAKANETNEVPNRSVASETSLTSSTNGLALTVYALGSLGSIGDSQGVVFPARSMLTWSPALSIGYRYKILTASFYGEYDFSYQTTPVTNVANQNATGQEYLAGPQLTVKLGSFSLGGSYLFMGQYQVSQLTISGQTSIYSGVSGFAVNLGWSLTKKLSALISAKDLVFSKWNVSDISNSKVTQLTYGIGLSYDLY